MRKIEVSNPKYRKKLERQFKSLKFETQAQKEIFFEVVIPLIMLGIHASILRNYVNKK